MGKPDYDGRTLRRRRAVKTHRYARAEARKAERRRERRFRRRDMRRWVAETRQIG